MSNITQEEFTKCPLSGNKLKNYGHSPSLDCYFFLVENQYLKEEIYYGVTKKFKIFYLENEENLSQKDKEKLWAVIVEKAIMGHKSFLIHIPEVEIENTSRPESEHLILYTLKELLDMYPKPSELIDRILGLLIKIGEIHSDMLPTVRVASFLNSGEFNNWELFFIYNFNAIKSIVMEMAANNLLSVNVMGERDISITLTLAGIERYNGLTLNTESNTCFVAMQFRTGGDKRDMLEFFKNVLKPAVAQVPPFEAKLVSDDPSGMKICDKIIADIKKSRFVLVDLTYSNSGAYYEAGFASALNKEVIYICEKKWFQDGYYDNKLDQDEMYKPINTNAPNGIHFDINHYPVIVYENNETGLKNLQMEIKYHIEARVPKH